MHVYNLYNVRYEYESSTTIWDATVMIQIRIMHSYSKDPPLRERDVKRSGLSKMLGGFKRMAGVVRSEV